MPTRRFTASVPCKNDTSYHKGGMAGYTEYAVVRGIRASYLISTFCIFFLNLGLPVGRRLLRVHRKSEVVLTLSLVRDRLFALWRRERLDAPR